MCVELGEEWLLAVKVFVGIIFFAFRREDFDPIM